MFYANLIKNNHDLTSLDEFLLFLRNFIRLKFAMDQVAFSLCIVHMESILLWKYLLVFKKKVHAI